MSRETELITALQPLRDHYISQRSDFTIFEVHPVLDRSGYFLQVDATWLYSSDHSDAIFQDVYDKYLELITDETVLNDIKFIKFINTGRKATFV